MLSIKMNNYVYPLHFARLVRDRTSRQGTRVMEASLLASALLLVEP